MIIEVELHKTAQLAFEAYSAAFCVRYSMKPPDPGGQLSERFRECLSRMSGHHEAVMGHYVAMSGANEWFITRGHSLECFVRDAALVYSDYMATRSSVGRGEARSRPIVVRLTMYCGNWGCKSGEPRGEFREYALPCDEVDEWVCPDCVSAGYAVKRETLKNPSFSSKGIVSSVDGNYS